MDTLLAQQRQDRDQRDREVLEQIKYQQSIFSRVDEQLKRSTQVLESIRRTFNRIDSLSGDVWFSIPHSHEAIAPYHRRMKKAVEAFLADPADNHDVYVSRSRPNDDGSSTPDQVAISDHSTVFPQQNEQPVERLLSMGLAVSAYRSPVEATDFLATRWSGRGQPDLQLSLSTQSPDLNVELEDYSLEMYSQLITDQQYWDTNGRIASIDDLPGSQLWFYVDRPAGFSDHPNSNLNELLQQLTRRVEIRTVVLRINEIDFWFRAEQLNRIETQDGTPAWTITLPPDADTLYEAHVHP